MNEQTPTPETDALDSAYTTAGMPLAYFEAMKLARKLERERDKARKTCAELVTDSNAITLAESLHKMEQERDDYKFIYQDEHDQLRMVCDNAKSILMPIPYNDEWHIAYNNLPHVKLKENHD